MPTVNQQVESHIQSFVTEISSLVRHAALEVEATAEKFLAFVKSNDGKRLEEISAGLKIPATDLMLPARKLLAAKAVKTTGQRRGTKYHAGGGSMSKATAAPAKRA